MDVLRRRACCWRFVDPADSRFAVGELYCRFLAGLALYQPGAACFLSRGGGLAGNAEFPFSGDGPVLDHLRSGANSWPANEFSLDCAMAIRGSDTYRPLRRRECQLDANHARYSKTGEFAGSVARTKSGTDQRSAPGARAQRWFLAAHGG